MKNNSTIHCTKAEIKKYREFWAIIMKPNLVGVKQVDFDIASIQSEQVLECKNLVLWENLCFSSI